MTTDVRCQGSLSGMEKPCIVLLDANAERSTDISHVVHQCGATVRHCGRLADAVTMQNRGMGGIAVLGTDPPDSCSGSALESIRLLKAAGFTVICCQDGVSRLPLGQQCLALLAGCSQLLDSTLADFAATLRAALQHRLLEQATKASEERELRSAMAAQGIVSESKAMLDVFRLLMRIAKLSHFPVLISGESGTGKELMANAIHRLDPLRRHGPFVAVNCGAIAHELAESAFFGHRRGAFTGADRDRKGLFRSADGGVLFLDEVAELDERMQTKLLRVLQEQRVLGLGDDLETRVDARVVAATNANLQARVRDGRFRADLYNRLNALAMHLPPLRERSEDIRPLAEHFIAKFRDLRGGAPPRATPDFMAALKRLELTGNARQLENLIRWTLLNKADDDALNLRDLPPTAWEQLSSEGTAAVEQATVSGERGADASVLALLHANSWSMAQALAACERLILRAALEHEHGNQSGAARLLGITARSVYNKLRKYSLQRPAPATHDEPAFK